LIQLLCNWHNFEAAVSHAMAARNILGCIFNNLILPESFYFFIRGVLNSSNVNMTADEKLDVIYKFIYIYNV
jgi:hypothetical protein